MKFRLSQDEDKQLVSELAAALEQAVNLSCTQTAPLWLDATRRHRAELMHSEMRMPFSPSTKFMALCRSSRSKYRSLAVWRHAVVWKQMLPTLPKSAQERALVAVYFTPFPSNAPPYAWSSAAAKAPGIKDFDGPRPLKRLAKEGAEQVVLQLCAYMNGLDRNHVLQDLTFKLIKPAVTTTACDVLKLEKSNSYGMTK